MPIDDRDERVGRIAAGQYGRICVKDLRRRGLDAHAVDWRVQKRRLLPVHRGAYAVGYVDDTMEARFTGAVRAGGERAALSGWATLAVCGFVDWDDARDVDVTVSGVTGCATATASGFTAGGCSRATSRDAAASAR